MASEQDLQAIVDGWNPNKTSVELAPEKEHILNYLYERSRSSVAVNMPAEAVVVMIAREHGLTRGQVDSAMQQLLDSSLVLLHRGTPKLTLAGYEVFAPERDMLSQIMRGLYRLHIEKSRLPKIPLPWLAKEIRVMDLVALKDYVNNLAGQQLVEQQNYQESGRWYTDVWLTELGGGLAEYLERQAGPAPPASAQTL